MYVFKQPVCQEVSIYTYIHVDTDIIYYSVSMYIYVILWEE